MRSRQIFLAGQFIDYRGIAMAAERGVVLRAATDQQGRGGQGDKAPALACVGCGSGSLHDQPSIEIVSLRYIAS